MLSQIHRLAKKNDFDAVFQKGKGVKRDFLAFRFMKNALPHSRFGFVVSKKVSPKATARNLVRRRLRSQVAQHLHNIKIPLDVVVVALPSATHKSFKDFQKVIDEFFALL